MAAAADPSVSPAPTIALQRLKEQSMKDAMAVRLGTRAAACAAAGAMLPAARPLRAEGELMLYEAVDWVATSSNSARVCSDLKERSDARGSDVID
jgi:hypothetical protein